MTDSLSGDHEQEIWEWSPGPLWKRLRDYGMHGKELS